MNLEPEFRYYLDHQNELVAKHGGKFLVIKQGQVIGEFESELEAIRTTATRHELGTFLVQKCELGSRHHTQVFHSRVGFA